MGNPCMQTASAAKRPTATDRVTLDHLNRLQLKAKKQRAPYLALANFAPRSRTMARAFLLCCCVLVVSSAVVKDVASGGGTSPRCETVYDPVLTPPRACSCALRPNSRIWFRGRRCLLPQGHGAFAPWRIQALRGPPRMLRSRRSTCARRNGVLPARRSIVRVAMTAAHPTLAIARL